MSILDSKVFLVKLVTVVPMMKHVMYYYQIEDRDLLQHVQYVRKIATRLFSYSTNKADIVQEAEPEKKTKIKMGKKLY